LASGAWSPQPVSIRPTDDTKVGSRLLMGAR